MNTHGPSFVSSLTFAAALACTGLQAAQPPEAADISLEDLLTVEVTSAARKAQRINDVAAAVFVVSREDIERSGATSIPEVLRMVPGVEVARLANNRWAVSVRGFNNRFANKLLVLMDGRSIYSPIFSGVLWENEDTLLEDIDRIEVIRGPGAAMWGANAVNGVINIITRRARDTQGNLLVAGAGSEERALAGFRHGGQAGGGHYRVWAKGFTRDEAVTTDGKSGNDYWRSGRAGFRADWSMAAGHRLTVSGQAYSSYTGDRFNRPDVASPTGMTVNNLEQTGKGAHLLGRNEWTLAGGSEMALQGYVDHTNIELAGTFKEVRMTIDLDFQHRLLLAPNHDVIWGVGYRRSSDRTTSGSLISVTPRTGAFTLASAFIHDDITLIPDTLRLMLGVRLEKSSFTNIEPMPNARLMWTPSENQSIWMSLSRAVRTPSRAELDAQVDLGVLPGGAPGNPTPLAILTRNVPDDHKLKVEKVTAYELGYRQQMTPTLSADLAAFHNEYSDLRSVALGSQRLVAGLPPYLVQEIVPNNSVEAYTRGIELALDWNPLSWWRIQPSYSYLSLHARSTTGDPSSAQTAARINQSDPQHQLSLRSAMSFSDRHNFDLWLRHVSKLGNDVIAAYTSLDLRYAWRPRRDFELSLVGQNLLDRRHPEFVPDLLPSQACDIERAFYVKAKWLF